MNQKSLLRSHHLLQVERAREDHHADEREGHRHFIGDELRRRTQAAEQRVLAVGGEPSEEQRVHAQRRDAENEQQADVDVCDIPVEHVSEPVIGAPRNHRVCEQCRTPGEARPHQVEDLVALCWRDVLFEEQLQPICSRLEHPEGSDPVRPVAKLDAGRDLSLSERQIRECGQEEYDEHAAFDEQDPPEIVRPDHATASALNNARPPLPARP